MSDTSIISVGPKGRIVIPVEVRRRLGIQEGSELVVLSEGDEIVLLPRAALKRRLRGMFAGVDTSLAAELIRDRRAAAEAEDVGR